MAEHGQAVFLLDGSDALKSAVLASFPRAAIKRCVIHIERGRLSGRHCGELAMLFKRLREVQCEAAGREVCRDIERFLEGKNATALASLREAGDERIALHLLDVPSTLHPSLLSTNIIENSFRRYAKEVLPRDAISSRDGPGVALALLEAERGFRRIDGYRDLADASVSASASSAVFRKSVRRSWITWLSTSKPKAFHWNCPADLILEGGSENWPSRWPMSIAVEISMLVAFRTCDMREPVRYGSLQNWLAGRCQ